jgi:hypothetical protein
MIVVKRSMPAYEIYFHCAECGREHPIHLKIHLDYGPEQKQSLAHFFSGRAMPPQATTIRGRKVFCLKTGTTLKLDSDDQIFLLPLPDQLVSAEK